MRAIIRVFTLMSAPALAVFLLSCTPAPAEEALTCAPHADIAAEIRSGYGEEPVAAGITTAGTVIELWTAKDGATWTLLVTMTDGTSCIVAAGEDWFALPAWKTARGRGL